MCSAVHVQGAAAARGAGNMCSLARRMRGGAAGRGSKKRFAISIALANGVPREYHIQCYVVEVQTLVTLVRMYRV